MKSNENYSISSNRFQTTYGSSYNRSYNLVTKSSIFRPFSDRDDKSKMADNSKSKIDNSAKFELIKPTQKPSSITQNDNKSISPTIQPINFPKTTNFDYNHMVTQIAMITESLYLSGIHAISVDKLKDLGVTLVVSLLADGSNMRLPSSIQVMQISIEDTENANIRRHFDRALERINVEERRKGKTLVHCMAGISRSSTLVIAYLMRYRNMRLREAYGAVLERRPYIQPNLGFWRQLIEYERTIFGSNSVTMVPLEGTRLLIPDVAPSLLPQILAASPVMRLQPRVPQSVFPFRSSY